jgi:hypothetical protein
VLESNADGIDVGHEKCLWPYRQDGTEIPCGCSQPSPKISSASPIGSYSAGDHRSPGIHGGVLDFSLRDSGATRNPSLF